MTGLPYQDLNFLPASGQQFPTGVFKHIKKPADQKDKIHPLKDNMLNGFHLM
jgi:hypothetical protein